MGASARSGKRVKVSVIIASYNSGEGIYDLIESLDAQSLPRDEFEAIVVDDGSTDSTFDRLQKLSTTRDYLRVIRIPNSGWPCRPRNIGLDAAEGEFVVFSDHDDVFYPSALENAFAFAQAAGADIVNGREARTSQFSWAVETYAADSEDAYATSDRFPLTPMNPHKLYRRSFLQDHNIRFREEGRVLWEDKFFNLAACRHTTKIATMASTPFYHWVDRGESTSSTFRRSRTDWWDWFGEVLRAATEELADPRWEPHRESLLLSEYHGNLLDSFNHAFPKRAPDEQRMIFARARELQQRYIGSDLDKRLVKNRQLRARLLRDGEFEALRDLAAADLPLTQSSQISHAQWSRDGLELSITAEWSSTAGPDAGLQVHDGRAILVLPESVRAVTGNQQLDLTEQLLASNHHLLLREQREIILWEQPLTVQNLEIGEPGGAVLRATLSGVLSPSDNGFGRPLSDFGTHWKPHLRSRVLGVNRSTGLASELDPMLWVSPAAEVYSAERVGKAIAVVQLSPEQLANRLRFDQGRTSKTSHPWHHVIPVSDSSSEVHEAAATSVFVSPHSEEPIGSRTWIVRPAMLAQSEGGLVLIVERRERAEKIDIAMQEPTTLQYARPVRVFDSQAYVLV